MRDIGGKEEMSMKKHKDNGYTDEPLGDVRVVDDFLSRVTTIPHLNRLRVIKIPQLETG